jgi:MSHA pilin protein MshC
MVELVLVLSILSVLTFVSIRYFSVTRFSATFQFEELRVALDYAHKRAIATGCHTQVDLSTNNSYRLLTVPDGAVPCDPASSFTAAVTRPTDGTSLYEGVFASGVTLTTNVDRIVFDGLGRIRLDDELAGISPLVLADVTVTIHQGGAPLRSMTASPLYGAFIEN